MATRREGILIEPYKQLRFGLMFLLINLIFASLFFLIFGYYLWDVYSTIAVYFNLSGQQSIDTFAKLAYPASIGFVIVVLFILVTLIMSARYTHQIYGPLVSIRRYLAELSEGKKPQPIKLRASDQLQDLATEVNQLGQKFYINEEELELICAYAERVANRTKAEIPSINGNEKIKRLISSLKKISEQL